MSSEPQFSEHPLCREVFLGALECSDPIQRAKFLDSACGDDKKLREEVEQVLREAGDLGGFMEAPVLSVAREAMPDSAGESAFTARITEQPGVSIGKYQLVQKLGEGGCGVVYLAQQQ